MQNIQISTGVQTYTFNGTCELEFNPTDSNFVKRLYAAIDTLQQKHEEYTNAIEAKADSSEIFDEAEKMDAETREALDGLFGKPVCAELFGTTSVYALSDGLPLWMNLLLAVVDIIDEQMDANTKLINPRLEKYISKYRDKKKVSGKK